MLLSLTMHWIFCLFLFYYSIIFWLFSVVVVCLFICVFTPILSKLLFDMVNCNQTDYFFLNGFQGFLA